METVVIIAIIALALAYFLFFRKRAPDAEPRRELRADRQRIEERPKGAEPGAPAPPKPSAEPLPKRRESVPPTADVSAERRSSAITPEPPLPPSRGPDVEVLRRGLARTRDSAGFFGRLKALLPGGKKIDASTAQEIEEVLLSSDVGASTTETILKRIRERLDRGELGDSEKVWQALRGEATRMLELDGRSGDFMLTHKPTVVLLVGVNGAGKTTTIGKLATRLKASGKTCVLAAGDTFRAAAVQQLMIWGQRVGCEVVQGKEGADPGSVVFDAIKRAQELGADVVLADTAGRLHTKANLMSEMQKIARSAGRALAGAPHETFLVIDATNGQNALAQAREFRETLEVTGIVLTKLDGTAKGGVVLGICDSLGVPVRFVGLGEGPDDLHEFIPKRFVDALLGDERAA
jgi:fused signal recognition particle receptor